MTWGWSTPAGKLRESGQQQRLTANVLLGDPKCLDTECMLDLVDLPETGMADLPACSIVPQD